jgi:uncharacterized protein (DUF433 family)
MYGHVVCAAGTLAREPHLAGTRIRVRDIAAARDLGGLSPEEIVAVVYPDLSLGQVYAALSYHEDHRTEIEQAAQVEAQRIVDFLRNHPELARDVRGA